MATIVNNQPPATSAPDNSSGPFAIVVVLIIILILVYLGFVYGFRAVRQDSSNQINIPSQFDVNVHQSK